MNNFKKNKQRGFSLIEAAIVVVIFGILVAVGLPNGITVKDTASLNSAKNAIHSMQTGEAIYVSENDTLGTTAQMIAGKALTANPLENFPFGTGATLSVVVGNVAGAGATPNGFDVDGNGTVDTLATENVAQVSITGVTPTDARNFGLKVETANTPAINIADTKGIVEYPAIASGSTGTVVVMIARR